MMISLSPSKLNLFKECPRCFFDAYADQPIKAVRPRGIFPSLPGGIDRTLKKYFDTFRGVSLPPELINKVDGALFSDIYQLNKWRNWRTGLKCILTDIDVKLIGALDDCLVNEEGFYIPLDYKTKGFEPKDDGSQYYQLQLDCYTLMLSQNDYPTCGKSYLAYYYPTNIVPPKKKEPRDGTVIDFGVSVYPILTDSNRALETIKSAAELLQGKRPEINLTCDYCNYVEAVRLKGGKDDGK